MGNRQFKKELMQKTIIYLMALLLVLFLITGYFYGRNLSVVTRASNLNFLNVMKSQTLHFLEHPIGEILLLEEQILDRISPDAHVHTDFHGYVLRMEYLDQDGIVIDTFPNIKSRIGMDLGSNPFIKAIDDEISFSDTFIDPFSGTNVMMVGKKIDNGNLLIGYMNLEKLSTAFDSFAVDGNMFAIVDNKGNYILHPNKDLVRSRSVDPNFKSIRDGSIEKGNLLTYSSRLVRVEYSVIENTGWYLLLYQDYFAAYGSLIINITLAILLMLFAFYAVIRSFRGSFNKLDEGFVRFIEMTKKVTQGNYSEIANEQKYKEFDELSKNFMIMIEEIEAREEEINKYNIELQMSRDELSASNDELSATLQQLMAIEKAHREQNEYLDHQNTRLSNLIKGTNAGTWEWDMVTNEVLINERWIDMLGYTLEEVAPFNLSKFLELVHPEDRTSLNDNLAPIYNKETDLLESKFRMKHKNNGWIWVNSIAKVSQRDCESRASMMSGIHIDITEAVMSAEKIHERLIETELIADFTSELLIKDSRDLMKVIYRLIDKVCSIKEHVYWDVSFFEHEEENGSLAHYNNYKVLLPKQIKNGDMSIYPSFYEALRGEKALTVFSKYSRDKLSTSEADWMTSNGFNCTVVCPLQVDGVLKGYLAFEAICGEFEIDHDESHFYKILVNAISEAMKKDAYEKGLIESKELADAANIAKSQFLANMSHEIRTPLNGILGYLHLISDSEALLEAKKYCDTAQKVTNSMMQLIDDILDFSKIEAGKLKIVHEYFDVRERFNEVLDMYRYEALNKKVTLEMIIRDEVPNYILMDTTRLKQIVSNLINNAIKFSNKGEIMIEVGYDDAATPRLIIKISDDGIGISEEQFNAVFEPFNQGDNSSRRKFGGTGLGLAIVKKLVEMLGGTIEIKSILDVGTEFLIVIPVEVIYEETSGSMISKPDKEPLEAYGIRILIVDDNEINQMVVQKVMEKKGFICDVAADGKAAIEAVKSVDYDCVFMDVQMPIMDGYEATEIIRNIPSKSRTYIVAMTANAMEGDREKCLQAGMDDYISKPLDYNLMAELAKARTLG